MCFPATITKFFRTTFLENTRGGWFWEQFRSALLSSKSTSFGSLIHNRPIEKKEAFKRINNIKALTTLKDFTTLIALNIFNRLPAFTDYIKRYRPSRLPFKSRVILQTSTLSWKRSLSYRNQSSICKANQWTGFYMIGTSVFRKFFGNWKPF